MTSASALLHLLQTIFNKKKKKMFKLLLPSPSLSEEPIISMPVMYVPCISWETGSRRDIYTCACVFGYLCLCSTVNPKLSISESGEMVHLAKCFQSKHRTWTIIRKAGCGGCRGGSVKDTCWIWSPHPHDRSQLSVIPVSEDQMPLLSSSGTWVVHLLTGKISIHIKQITK